MKKEFIILFYVIILFYQSKGQNIGFQWGQCYGGTSEEGGFYDNRRSCLVIPTSDGGYMLAGNTSSINTGDVTGNHGLSDVWLAKMSNTGAISWQKCFGGTQDERINDIKQTADGGYVFVGSARSNNGDVSGNHGLEDVWVVKINTTGNIQWQKCFGGSNFDSGTYIELSTDGGYIITGETNSTNGDVVGNHGNSDVWVVKMNSTGALQWQHCYGGSGADWAWTILNAVDGGYIISGSTETINNGDVTGNHGGKDVWIIKINSSGALLWQHCYGGSGDEVSGLLIKTMNNEYVFSGQSTSLGNNGDVSGNHGGSGDIWVVKINSTGALQWQKCYGGSAYEWAWFITETPEQGLIVVGATDSNNSGDVTGNHGSRDIWVLKINESGGIIAANCFGGSNMDWGTYACPSTISGEYMIAGTTKSVNGNVTGLHGTNADLWLTRLSIPIIPPEMVPVQGGTFTMGCTSEQMPDCFSNENPSHEVTLSDFEIGKYEVTQGQWMALMSDVNPSGTPYFPNCGSNCPIERVSWYDAAVFCNRLSQSAGYTPCYYSDAGYTQVYGKSGSVWSLPNTGTIYWNQDANGYRLPTEAEWEYAARGGSQSNGYKYAGTSNLDSLKYYCNYINGGDGYDNLTSPVGSFLPNEFTLFDMSGNVIEWCYDWYGYSYYANSPSCAPVGESSGSGRVLRGGSWNYSAVYARVANRNYAYPDYRYYLDGFRLSRTP